MVKKRVHEIAREFNIESKEIINKLSGIGLEVKSHMSTLEDAEVDMLRKHFGGSRAAAQGEVSVPKTRAPQQQADKTQQDQKTAAPPQSPARDKSSGDAGTNRAGEKRPQPQDGWQKRQDRRDSRGDRGPGLVDRVPSRPPDRRFDERAGRPQPPRQAAPGAPRQQDAMPPGQPEPEQAQPAARPIDAAAPVKPEAVVEQPVSASPEQARAASEARPPEPRQAPPDRAREPLRQPQNNDRAPGVGQAGQPRDNRPQTGAQGPRPGERGAQQGGAPPFRQGNDRPYNQDRGPRPGGQTGYAGGQQGRPPYGGQPGRPPGPGGQQARPPYGGQPGRPPGPGGQQARPPYGGQPGRPPGPGGQQARPPYGGQPGRPPGPGGQQARPPYGGGQPGRPPYGGQPGGRPPGPGGQQGRPPYGGGQPGRPPGDLKVPKVPEQAKGLDKIKASEKSRLKVQNQKSQLAPKAREKSGRPGDDNMMDRKKRPYGKRKPPRQGVDYRPPIPVEKKPVVMGESISVQELAEKMKKSPAEIIKKLIGLGVMATINQELDYDTACIMANDFGFEVEVKIQLDAEAVLEQEQEDDPGLLEGRPSVVTIMGHVDHGKTSLLDAIRETNVIATEAGGITQHIGAYQVEHNNKKITFVDTPGHEAFTAMRARGARVTDIAILVVAAEDGVMPQTVEAINHIKAAEVPMIVALNKMDKPGANPDRVKQQLTEHGVVTEEWGGEAIVVPVSAKSGQGLNDLLEMILLVSEVNELKANPQRAARGTVIEAELDKNRGPVATVLVQNGSLNIGDNIIAGTAFGRVRAMVDDKGRRVKKASPSTPVEVLGFHDCPLAGDIFYVANDEKTARQVADKRTVRRRQEELKGPAGKISLEDLFKQIQEGQVKELNLIVKADVQGSVEAVKQSLERLSTGEVKVNIIHGGVGAITETDIMLASASNAIIIGFNVRPDVNARKAAEVEKIDLRLYRVIYDAIEDVKAAMTGLLEPEIKEVILGRVEVRKIFKASKLGTIAGCYVLEGKVTRDSGIRLIRDSVVVFEGTIDSLKRFKDDAKEVLQGYECGITIEKYNDMREGDVIEAFTTESIKRELA